MLVYAIVLILVMLVTNSPAPEAVACRGQERRLQPWKRKESAAAMTEEQNALRMVPVPSDAIIPERDLDKPSGVGRPASGH